MTAGPELFDVMKVQKIKKNLTSEMVIQEILNNMKSGDLKPGDKLPTEREMSQMLGVGRSSIREAVKGLVLMGYQETSQGKGTFVRNDVADSTLSYTSLQNLMAIVEKAHEQYEKFIPDQLCPPEQAIQTAEQIVTSLLNGDAQDATRYMQAHLTLVEVELKRVLSDKASTYTQNSDAKEGTQNAMV